MDTRRGFLRGVTLLGAAAGVWGSLRAEAAPQPQQGKPKGLETTPIENPNLPSPEKAALEANEKDIKKKVDQLYQLATELKTEVDKTDSRKVLSLSLLKKTEEIEKLARDIRNRSKG